MVSCRRVLLVMRVPRIDACMLILAIKFPVMRHGNCRTLVIATPKRRWEISRWHGRRIWKQIKIKKISQAQFSNPPFRNLAIPSPPRRLSRSHYDNRTRQIFLQPLGESSFLKSFFNRHLNPSSVNSKFFLSPVSYQSLHNRLKYVERINHEWKQNQMEKFRKRILTNGQMRAAKTPKNLR